MDLLFYNVKWLDSLHGLFGNRALCRLEQIMELASDMGPACDRLSLRIKEKKLCYSYLKLFIEIQRVQLPPGRG